MQEQKLPPSALRTPSPALRGKGKQSASLPAVPSPAAWKKGKQIATMLAVPSPAQRGKVPGGRKGALLLGAHDKFQPERSAALESDRCRNRASRSA